MESRALSDEHTDVPAIAENTQLPVAPGLAHDERVRLEDLKERFRTTSYPRMLGLDWAFTPPEVDRRVPDTGGYRRTPGGAGGG